MYRPTCDCVAARQVKGPKKLVQKGRAFTTKDVEAYESKVLGYHRRHEKAMTDQELRKIGHESASLISQSVDGYAALEHAAERPPAPRPARPRHSAAYAAARQAAGFQGYYHNVFDFRGNAQTEAVDDAAAEHANAPGFDRYRRRGGAGARGRGRRRRGRGRGGGGLEAARRRLEGAATAERAGLSSEERGLKQIVGAKLRQEEAAVALAAHQVRVLAWSWNQALVPAPDFLHPVFAAGQAQPAARSTRHAMKAFS